MSRCQLAVAVALTASLCTAHAEAAPVLVYSQPSASPSNVYFSEDSGDLGPVWRMFDDFSIADSNSIIALTWSGGYVDTNGVAPPVPDSTGFAFRFYADNAGTPGAQLYEQSVGFASIAKAFLGNGTAGGLETAFYSFGAYLPAPFHATGGVKYWLAISSISPTWEPTGWAWLSGTGGDGLSLQVTGNTQIERGRDRQFQLYAVPEPSTLVLVSLGVASVLRARRRQ